MWNFLGIDILVLLIKNRTKIVCVIRYQRDKRSCLKVTELQTLFERAVSMELKECLDLSRWQGDLNHTYINEHSHSILLNCSHSQQEYYIAFHVKLYCRRLARNVMYKSMFRCVCLIEWASNGAKVRFCNRVTVLRNIRPSSILTISQRCCCWIMRCFGRWTQWSTFPLEKKMIYSSLDVILTLSRDKSPHIGKAYAQNVSCRL